MINVCSEVFKNIQVKIYLKHSRLWAGVIRVSIDDKDRVRKSTTCMVRNGTTIRSQKAHLVLRFESSAVHPDMISSSYNTELQYKHREQDVMIISMAIAPGGRFGKFE